MGIELAPPFRDILGRPETGTMPGLKHARFRIQAGALKDVAFEKDIFIKSFQYIVEHCIAF